MGASHFFCELWPLVVGTGRRHVGVPGTICFSGATVAAQAGAASTGAAAGTGLTAVILGPWGARQRKKNVFGQKRYVY